MTLVAGFLCSDGYVVAADTEMTYDAILYQGKKLESYDSEDLRYGLKIGYAGDASYGTMLAQKIRDAVDSLGPEPRFHEMKARVEEVVHRVHEDQIFKIWAATGQQEPRVDLIVAMEDVEHRAGILRTDRNAIFQVMKYAFIGTGSYLAEYIAQRLFGERAMSTAVTHHLVRQLFREVKGKGAYVGGNTEIVSRLCFPRAERFFDLRCDNDERFLWGLDQVLLSAVRLALGSNSNRKSFENRLDFIRTKLEELWGWSHQTAIPREGGDERLTKVLDTEWDNPFEDV